MPKGRRGGVKYAVARASNRSKSAETIASFVESSPYLKAIENEFGPLKNYKVVLTENQRAHIEERHPDILDKLKYAPEVINDPDYILKSSSKDGTILAIKELPEFKMNLVIRLSLADDPKDKNNSIITAHLLSGKTIAKTIRKNKMLYKKGRQ